MNDTVLKLRDAARRLREEMNQEGQRRAADLLDELADRMEKANNGMFAWVTRGLAAVVLVLLAMVVAGVWVDWRWLATAAVPGLLVIVLGSVMFVMGEERRGR